MERYTVKVWARVSGQWVYMGSAGIDRDVCVIGHPQVLLLHARAIAGYARGVRAPGLLMLIMPMDELHQWGATRG